MIEKNKIWSLLIKVVLIFVIFEVMVNTIGSLLSYSTYSSLLNGKYIIYAVSEFIVFIFAIVLLFIRKKLYILKERKLSFKESFKLCLPVIIVIFLILLINSIKLFNATLNIDNLISLIIYATLIGLFEEIFFRGIIENELLDNLGETKKGVIASIIISGFIFGAVHLTNFFVGQGLTTTLMQIIQTTALGILFGTIYYKTRNIWSVIFLHGFYDFAVLFSQNNLILDCSYTTNIPISLTIYLFVTSIILSIIYILYSASIYSKEKSKLYNKCIFIIIGIYFINNIVYSMAGPNPDKYYICTNYDKITFKEIETHYYSYDNYLYTTENGTIYSIYRDNNTAILDDTQGNKKTLDVKNVKRIIVIDNYLLIIGSDSTSNILYVKDLNNIDKEFTSYKIPRINSLGYLYSKDNNAKYPLVKSYINDLFIIDDNTIKQVEIK